MSTSKEADVVTMRDYRVDPGSPLGRAWQYPAYAAGVGVGIAGYGYITDPGRFAFSYLFAFFVTLSLALGSLFFVLVLYMTKANWGIAVRRVAELFIRPMALFAVLVIPLIISLPKLFPWVENAPKTVHEAHSEGSESALVEARGLAAREPAAFRDLPVSSPSASAKADEEAEARIVDHKRPYLNKKFFLLRLIAYLFIWTWLGQRYFQWSTNQDKTKSLENTAAAQRFTPAALIIFGFTLTFWSFDWLLSLDKTWYSTIFGVYIFASCALFQMATLILTTLLLRRTGVLGSAVSVEHFHDMGKLLFGWIVFWSYIAFAQFFLQWYSNIPDEVAFFHKRWDENGGAWKGVSLSLVVLHFFVPFWFLMSRNIKRRLTLLAVGAGCMVVMHMADAYWIIMPNFGPFEPSPLDLGCLLALLGIYLAIVLRGMHDVPLIPVGDPRLARSLEFENA